MKFIKSILTVVCLLFALNTWSQEAKRFKIHTVAFYNLENLFDTINDTTKNDEATPIMELNTNREEIYN